MRYVDAVCLRDATFKATPAGARYCREFTNRKSGKVGARFVVAWVEGTPCDCGETDGVDVTYNPFRADEFTVRGTTTPVHTASHVAFRTHGRGKASKPETRVRA